MDGPFQNPYEREAREMRPSVRGREHLRIKRDYDPLPEVDEETISDIKSPWLKRVFLKRARRRNKKLAADRKSR